MALRNWVSHFLAMPNMPCEEEETFFVEDRIRSGGMYPDGVCMETSNGSSRLWWQGPQSRVTLDRFHRAPEGLVCRGFEAAATDSFWKEGKVHGYIATTYRVNPVTKRTGQRVGGEVRILCLRVRCCVLQSGELGGIMALLISPLVVGLTPLFSLFSLPFFFYLFYFILFSFLFLSSVVCLHFHRFLRWREDGRGQGTQITEGVDNVVSNLIIVALH